MDYIFLYIHFYIQIYVRPSKRLSYHKIELLYTEILCPHPFCDDVRGNIKKQFIAFLWNICITKSQFLCFGPLLSKIKLLDHSTMVLQQLS